VRYNKGGADGLRGMSHIVLGDHEDEVPRKWPADMRGLGGLTLIVALLAASAAPLVPVPGIQACGPHGTSDSTSSMTFARSGHTATLLRSGKVLVAGGWVSPAEFTTSSAELYDPATGRWSVTGSMKSARAFHAAALLASGKVLVAGGRSSAVVPFSQDVVLPYLYESITSAEVYDPDTGNWTETGSMRNGRDSFTAIVLRSGKVFASTGIAFYSEVAVGSAELYDPASGSWSAIGNWAPVESATLLASGRVLLIGVYGARLYDPATGGWKPTGRMTTTRGWHTATLLSSGKVLVAGGAVTFPHPISSAEIYDPVTNTWTPTRSMTNAHLGANAIQLPSGEVLVAGGGTGTERMATLDSVDLYNPATASWMGPGSMAAPRSYFTATMLRSGALLFAGGESSTPPFLYTSTEIYALTCPSG
jgi:galactose oxidase-like protein/Kelch motif protein